MSCPQPSGTPLSPQRHLESDAWCWTCKETGDPHLSWSFYCSRCCPGPPKHLPTHESLRAFGEKLAAHIEYARSGGTDAAYLSSIGILP